MFGLIGNGTDSIDQSGLREISSQAEESHFEERLYIKFKDLGIEILVNTDEDVVDTVFIYSKGYRFLASEVLFPKGVNFHSSRSEVHSVLGPPLAREVEGQRTILGPVKPWDVYQIDRFQIHLQYPLEEDRLELITVSRR